MLMNFVALKRSPRQSTPKFPLRHNRRLRAIVEIDGAELRVFPIATSDGEEREILDALRFIRDEQR